LGQFRLVEEIGAGGMGIVYRARDTRLERDVAVKVLNAKTLSDDSARRQFRREALILSRLNHPNVEAVYDFHSEQGIDYLVMEYVPGLSLNEHLKKGALPEKEVLELGIQLARGLAAAHAQRIIHRDLKPGNLKLTPDNVLKILDFGLAQLFTLPEDETVTQTVALQNPAAGTPAYLSPEQAMGKEPDVRSDIYSAGVVLYELAAGSRPFPERGEMLRWAILYQKPPALRLKNKDISPGLEGTILKCLEKDPGLRYQSANDLLEDLKELARGSGPQRAVAVVRPDPERQPKSWLLVGVAMVLVLAAVLTFRNKILEWVGILPAVPAMKHVAVLPFHMIGAQPQEAALLDGLTDTVTNRLMQLTGSQPVGIIPFSEITSNHVGSMQEARAKLGANLALDGNVQRKSDQLQINLALADIETHRQLRADSVTGTPTDFKQLEEKVVDAAVRMLELELHKNLPKDEARATTSSEAYQAYTRGRGYLSRPLNPEDNDSAIAEFTRALELDPGYAAAYAMLGSAQWNKYEQTKDPEWIARMRDSCQHAQRLAPSSAAANICLGMLEQGTGRYDRAESYFRLALDADPTNDFIYKELAAAYQHLGRFEQAEKTYQKAIQTHPENPSGYAWLGALYAREARYDAAAAQFEKAIKLAPDGAGHWSSLGGTYLLAGVYPKAEYALGRAISLQPSYEAYTNLGDTYFLERKFPEAIAAFQQAVVLGDRQLQAHGNLARAYYWYPPQRVRAKAELRKATDMAESELQVNPRNADVHTLAAEYYAMLGDKGLALQHLQAALQFSSGDPETAYYAAKVYNLLGDRDEALIWLDKSVSSGYSPAEINDTVELDSLRQEPRFQALTQRMQR
jgi:serine/threonine-protein kinase